MAVATPECLVANKRCHGCFVSLTTEINRQLAARANLSVDAKIFDMAVEVDKADADHMHVTSFGLEPQCSVGAIAKPFFGLANIDDVAIDVEANCLLAEQFPISLVPNGVATWTVVNDIQGKNTHIEG